MDREDALLASKGKPIRIRRAKRATEYGGLALIVLGTSMILLVQLPTTPQLEMPATEPDSLGTTLRDLETSVYEQDLLRASVSARELRVSQPRLLGPIRIGFLRHLEASDVTVRTFPSESQDGPTRFSSGNREIVSSLVPEPLRAGVIHAEVERLRMVEHGNAGSTVTVEAARCRVAGAVKIVCRDGIFQDGAGAVPFRDAWFDGKRWRIAK
jgi:hypothetical protein